MAVLDLYFHERLANLGPTSLSPRIGLHLKTGPCAFGSDGGWFQEQAAKSATLFKSDLKLATSRQQHCGFA